MSHPAPLPLRAAVRDRTGQDLEITAGARDGEAVVAVARPGHRPILEFVATPEQLDDVAAMVHTLQSALGEQS